MSVPDPDRGALAFAEKVLTLLDEGRFTATYKYAVLLALMDLCLERSNRDGVAPSSVTTRQLADKILELYWPHSVPYQPEGTTRVARVLLQNRPSSGRSGGQAAIVSAIRDFREKHSGDPSEPLGRARYRQPGAFKRLVRKVEWTLVEMPLPRLQLIGKEQHPFIYRIEWDEKIRKGDFNDYERFPNAIRFVGDAGDHLVRLAGLLRPLIQRQWAGMVAQLNREVIPDAQLEGFLFGEDRISLEPVRGVLTELQDNRCFYCDARLRNQVQVDHFIPWARYPNNGIENLVVADARCNNDKRDHLASGEHVQRWVERTRDRTGDLDDIATRLLWDRHPDRSLGVARSIYLRLPVGAHLWRSRGEFVKVERGALQRALATV